MPMEVVIMIMTKVINAEEKKRNIQYHVLLIITNTLGNEIAMTKTGLAEWIATRLMAAGASFGLITILIMLYILMNLFIELILNNDFTVIMLIIGLEMAVFV